MTHDPHDLDPLHAAVAGALDDRPFVLVYLAQHEEPDSDGMGLARVGVMAHDVTPLQALSLIAGLQVDLVATLARDAHHEHLVEHLRDDLDRGVDALIEDDGSDRG